MSILTNTPSSYLTTSTPQWQGSKPCRFKGGRIHHNHPPDQLDHLLLGNDTSQAKMLGPSKKRITSHETLGSFQQQKSHIRTYQNSNKSNIVLTTQDIPKLIKIPKKEQQLAGLSPIYRVSNIGQSKLKKIQEGKLKSGIYRNFYKSQFKEESALRN